MRLNSGVLAFCLLLCGCGDGLLDSVVADTPAPLVIAEQGSFFIGGEVRNRGPGDDVTIDQMYVQYQVPQEGDGIPMVLTHGCCLSSKTWETTPDGRMGWDEYFVRKGHPVYLAEQSSRARSGFDATIYNQVARGEVPPDQQPEIIYASHQDAWDTFRFGPVFGEPFEDIQFPMESLNNFWKQMIPDPYYTLPLDNPSWSNLADLADRLGAAVLIGHSQSGTFPLEAAIRNPDDVSGLVMIEPGLCFLYGNTDEQIEVFAGIPILVVFGDYLTEAFDGVWQVAFDACVTLIDRVNNAGGSAEMLYTPERGIFGNSHMLMQDRNNLQIADLILEWIEQNVE